MKSNLYHLGNITLLPWQVRLFNLQPHKEAPKGFQTWNSEAQEYQYPVGEDTRRSKGRNSAF